MTTAAVQSLKDDSGRTKAASAANVILAALKGGCFAVCGSCADS